MPTEEQINHLRHAVGHDPEAERTLEQLLALVEPPAAPQKPHAQAEALREQARERLDNRAMLEFCLGMIAAAEDYPVEKLPKIRFLLGGRVHRDLAIMLTDEQLEIATDFLEEIGAFARSWFISLEDEEEDVYLSPEDYSEAIETGELINPETGYEVDMNWLRYELKPGPAWFEDALTDASQALAAVREFQSDREFWIKPIENSDG
jgi:hypothetical protein